MIYSVQLQNISADLSREPHNFRPDRQPVLARMQDTLVHILCDTNNVYERMEAHRLLEVVKNCQYICNQLQ